MIQTPLVGKVTDMVKLDQFRKLVEDRLRDKALSPAAASRLAVGNPYAVYEIRKGREPKFETLRGLCDALGLEFYIGLPRQGDASTAPAPPDWTTLSSREASHRGIERCNGWGWGKDVPRPDTLPLPQAVGDKDAFWVTATGASMAPEGIESGRLCLVSPAAQPEPGDRIWIRDTSGAASIKRLVSIEDDGTLHLRNWRYNPAGQPQSFEEKRFPADIERVHPVVAVFKGKPGSEHFEHVSDPGAPASPQVAAPPELIAVLGLPEGASMADAVSTIEGRMKDAGDYSGVTAAITTQMEALRLELKAEIADAKFAVYEGLADASALAGDETHPPGARPVAVVELASVAGGGATFFSEDVLGRVWFRRAWLDEHDLDAEHCAVVGVMGDAMEPTLMDGAKILIDRMQTDWRTGDIFVIQAPEGLVVKRAGEDANGSALMLSDNPSSETAAWPDEAKILGRVVWTARTLVGK